MADGNAVIQGGVGWPGNRTQSPTRLVNSAGGGDGTALYLFAASAAAGGDGLYAVGRGLLSKGVRAFSYDGDGVEGVALGPLTAAGVRGRCFSVDSSSAGVVGENPNSAGVRGEGGGAGVLGEASLPGGAGVQGTHRAGVTDGTGVYGFARTGVWGAGAIGVVGQSERSFGIGVEGDASEEGGIGVYGATTGARGVGVYATAPDASSAALQVNGRAVFSTSGRLIVPAGATSAAQAGLSLSAATLVFAVLQEDRPGVAVRAAVPDAAQSTVTVHLTQPAPSDTAVAWFVLN